MKDYTGLRSGKLEAVRFSHRQGYRVFWLVRYDCGRERAMRVDGLVSGHSNSCGCSQRGRKNNLKHGLYYSRSYSSWARMIDRCTNPNNARYGYYGGRGISVCERWRIVENFVADMGERPPGLTLERIDSDGDYEPGNCIWGTRSQQVKNRRNNVFIEARGKRQLASEWCDELGIPRQTIYNRLLRGERGEYALRASEPRFGKERRVSI